MGLDPPHPALAGDLVELRRWSLGDLACVRAASADPVIPLDTTVPCAWSPEHGRAWIERQWARTRDGEGVSLAIVDATTQQASGCVVALHREDPAVVGLGWWLISEARGRGLAAQAAGLLAAWALRQDGVRAVEALVAAQNAPSLRVAERAGLAERGRRGHLRVFAATSDEFSGGARSTGT